MTRATEVTGGLWHGRPASRIDLACPHGASTFILFPAALPGGDRAAMDVMSRLQSARSGCSCEAETEDPSADGMVDGRPPAPAPRRITPDN